VWPVLNIAASHGLANRRVSTSGVLQIPDSTPDMPAGWSSAKLRTKASSSVSSVEVLPPGFGSVTRAVQRGTRALGVSCTGMLIDAAHVAKLSLDSSLPPCPQAYAFRPRYWCANAGLAASSA